MDAFQKRHPHLNWGWLRRKRFLFRYDFDMLVSYWKTRWAVWRGL